MGEHLCAWAWRGRTCRPTSRRWSQAAWPAVAMPPGRVCTTASQASTSEGVSGHGGPSTPGPDPDRAARRSCSPVSRTMGCPGEAQGRTDTARTTAVAAHLSTFAGLIVPLGRSSAQRARPRRPRARWACPPSQRGTGTLRRAEWLLRQAPRQRVGPSPSSRSDRGPWWCRPGSSRPPTPCPGSSPWNASWPAPRSGDRADRHPRRPERVRLHPAPFVELGGPGRCPGGPGGRAGSGQDGGPHVSGISSGPDPGSGRRWS
jgi:hypothetical protein